MYTLLSYQLWSIYAFAQDAPNLVAEHFRRLHDDRQGNSELISPAIALITLSILIILVVLYFTVVKPALSNTGKTITNLTNTSNGQLGGVN
jgi:uncharacterized protein YoxC